MKKMCLLILLCASLYVDAQYITTYAKNNVAEQTNGIYYYLPQNVLRVDVTVEQTNYHKGPLSNYAEQMLDVYDYIRSNSVSYSIKNVEISTMTQPDPNSCFYVYPDDKNKESSLPTLNLTPDGIISSFGYNVINEHHKEKEGCFKEKEKHDRDLCQKKDDNISFIKIMMNPDDVEEDGELRLLTAEEQAVIAVENIYRIQQAYYDLVTGYQEVDYGNTMKYMVEEINELKNEYISLFTGKTSKKIIKKTFYITPEAGQENSTVNVARFSKTDGLFSLNEKKGEVIKLKFKSEDNLKDINYLDGDIIKTSAFNNTLLYRIPQSTTVEVLFSNETLAEEEVEISQFGGILTCTTNKMKIRFNTDSGQIISISKE